MHCACVISRNSNDGKQVKEDLIRPTKLNMAAKFVENFIFLRGIGERNDVQNLKLSFILYILKHQICCVYDTLSLKIHKAAKQ